MGVESTCEDGNMIDMLLKKKILVTVFITSHQLLSP